MLLLKFGDQPCWNDPWYQMLVTKQGFHTGTKNPSTHGHVCPQNYNQM